MEQNIENLTKVIEKIQKARKYRSEYESRVQASTNVYYDVDMMARESDYRANEIVDYCEHFLCILEHKDFTIEQKIEKILDYGYSSYSTNVLDNMERMVETFKQELIQTQTK